MTKEDMPAPISTLDDLLSGAAQKHFGIPFLKPIQRLVISNILECHQYQSALEKTEEGGTQNSTEEDRTPYQIIILPTGTGKSLCFQLPALLFSGLTVIVYPLLGLIADQYRALQKLECGVAVMTGSTWAKNSQDIIKQVTEGKVRVLLTNPETLLQPKVLNLLTKHACDHLVIDEAHCVYEWGETFRSTYSKIGTLVESNTFKVVSAFTATASPLVLEKIATSIFGTHRPHVISTNPDRANISYHILPTCFPSVLFREVCTPNTNTSTNTSANIDLAQWKAGNPLPRPALVFCRSRVAAQHYAHQLRRAQGGNVRFYHAGLSQEERTAIEEWFLKSNDGILCATCAYGMGMDKPNIRAVLHVEMPSSIESYLQETGRAGRDGEQSIALLLRPLVRVPVPNTQKGETITEMAHKRMEAVESFVYNTSRCRRAMLASYLGGEVEECSGCDICNGTFTALPARSMKIIRWMHRNNRRYNAAEIEKQLKTTICSEFTRTDISDMCAGLQNQGLLRCGKGIFKSALVVPRLQYQQLGAYMHSRTKKRAEQKG